MPDSSWKSAFLGSLVADAFAMPVHWYYDRNALVRDYGVVQEFVAPKNPHADSILWRSEYTPVNEKGDILREQAAFWGQRGIHYHQFLEAGENTVNYRLAAELVRWSDGGGGYEADAWLERYIELMLTPGWHRDTYLEEYHRGFFMKYASGKAPRKCAIRDEHIGGLAQVAAVCLAAEKPDLAALRATVREHVGLTHEHKNVQLAADTLVRLLWKIGEDVPLRDAIQSEAGDWFSAKKAERWIDLPDSQIIGQKYSPACYIDQSMPASIYLAWKYHDDFFRGIQANAMVGGDNCHRGAVVGALLGAANGVDDKWVSELHEPALLDRVRAIS